MNDQHFEESMIGEANLVDLARQGSLPRFQRMDMETLEWIAAHRPPFEVELVDEEEGFFSFEGRTAFIGPEEFLEPRIVDGLHGMRHALRVAIHAQRLAAAVGLSPTERLLVEAAAFLHDVRRVHDRSDAGHGERCATWIEAEGERIGCLGGLSMAMSIRPWRPH